MYFEKEFIEKIRSSVQLEDIAQKYIPSLKKRGRNYIGLCPFHKEKTPSFSISPEKQIFQCFGCNTGGNVFTFISKIENVSFVESVKRIAEISGFELPGSNDASDNQIATIRRINKYAMNFYNAYLHSDSGISGINYLRERGLTDDAIKSFKLGFSPQSWDRLSVNLKKNRADMELAEKIGLIGKSKKYTGSFYDKFRERIIFPIFDRSNNVVAFGGRTLKGDIQPKYLNSSESEIFHKRDILYGLNFAQHSIKEMDRAIIVEGYLDVIGCHQSGLQNVVAPLGTALTENHIKTLSQMCNEIVMLFDSDSAGINASLKSIETSRHFNAEIRIAVLPSDDPFDFIIKNGIRELMAVIDTAENPVDFQIRTILDKNRGKDYIHFLNEIFTVIKGISYYTDTSKSVDSEKSRYITKLSQIFDIDEESLRSDYKRFERGERNIKKENRLSNGKISYETLAYRELLNLIFHYPEITGDVLIDFPLEEINDPLTNSIMTVVYKIYNTENEFRVDKIFDFFPSGIEMEFLNDSLQKEATTEDPKAAYTEIYVNLKLHNIDKKINDYYNRVKLTGSERLDYLAEIEVLRREKEKLNNYIYNRGTVAKEKKI